MVRKMLFICMVLVASVMSASTALAAGDPSLNQVYQAAESGRLNDALSMMDQVLRDHPNSAKAHFVEAELLAKQGRLDNATAELRTAERIAPGLPFANAQAIESLRQRLLSSSSTAGLIPSSIGTKSSPASQFPIGVLLMVAALIAAVIYFVRKMNQPRATAYPSAGGAEYGNGFGSGAPLPPAGAGSGMAPMGQATGGGVGSGILGGLATGAALGAGMVAGEALMHRFTDGGRHHDAGQSSYIPASYDRDASTDDMGGSDFGISDSGSWDDSASGGGDDWT